eukprot:Anaeramoba_ignava/c21076_g1_i1.p1 GENE.c21076_g1_i1~~c21076_g1_i1.p1  ORF type:complete len:479 (+),score=175.08 c21076_g1_i1:195-1631(+)
MKHEIDTKDDYELCLFSIVNEDVPPPFKQFKTKPPVFFQHGLFDSCFSSVLDGPKKAISFLLADEGYHVFIGNSRVNGFSVGHKKYTERKDAYWSFGWQHMAEFDVPANLNYVLEFTEFSKICYIGHSQGTSQMFGALCLDKKRKLTNYWENQNKGKESDSTEINLEKSDSNEINLDENDSNELLNQDPNSHGEIELLPDEITENIEEEKIDGKKIGRIIEVDQEFVKKIKDKIQAKSDKEYFDISDKLEMFIALAPVCYVGNVGNALLINLASFNTDFLLMKMGIRKVDTHAPLLRKFAELKSSKTNVSKAVSGLLKFLDGSQIDPKNLPLYSKYLGGDTSIMNLRQWAFEIRKKRFHRFDYGSSKTNKLHYSESEYCEMDLDRKKKVNFKNPPSFDLSLLEEGNPKIVLFYGDQDRLADLKDVELLLKTLKFKPFYTQRDKDFGHMDYVLGMNAPEKVYKKIIELIKNIYQEEKKD